MPAWERFQLRRHRRPLAAVLALPHADRPRLDVHEVPPVMFTGSMMLFHVLSIPLGD